jgi:hypothetical protein
MTNIAKALGLDEHIEINGQQYELAAPDSHILDEFADWLANQALGKVERQRELISGEVYQERYKAMVSLIAQGTLDVGKPGFNEALTSLEGSQHLIFLCLRACNPDVTKEFVATHFRTEINKAILAKIEEDAKARVAKEVSATAS